MNITVELTKLFKTSLTGIEVWTSTIPESSKIPAIAISNVAFANDRDLSGSKTKNISNWRITLVDTVQNLQDSINQILLVDNTVSEHFQRLYVELSLIEPKQLTEPYQRAIFDIRVYPK